MLYYGDSGDVMLLNELLWLLLMGPVSLGLGLVIKAEWLWLADGGWV